MGNSEAALEMLTKSPGGSSSPQALRHLPGAERKGESEDSRSSPRGSQSQGHSGQHPGSFLARETEHSGQGHRGPQGVWGLGPASVGGPSAW